MRINETDKLDFRNVWVVADLLAGKIQSVTHELIGSARNLADQRNSEVWVIVMGDSVSKEALSLFAYGADCVVAIDDPLLKSFVDELEANLLTRLIQKYKPEIVLCAATARGRALIPRVSVMTDCGLTADCTELSIDPENGDLLQTRPAFGGNILATIRSSNHRPQMASVRPRVMISPDPDPTRTGIVIMEDIQDSDLNNIKQVIEVVQDVEYSVNIADANIIIAGGRGMKGAEGFELLKQMNEYFGGAVGASRAAVDAGWIPYSHQVGQTGQTVQTSVYIACGISGQIQHLVGMQSCDLIIAIDKNPNTPMMQMADIAVVGDIFEIIPEIISELRSTQP
jgi:electron transfer flavoprotein alpha subunit